MEEETNDVQDISNPENEVDETSNEDIVVDDKTFKELEEKFKKEKEISSNYKIRAEKAEAKAKAVNGKVEEAKPTPNSDLTQTDLFALMKSDVAEEDVEEVIKMSKLLGVSVKEALKDSSLQAVLDKRIEARKVANATNTSKTRTSTNKISDEQLLKKVNQGDEDSIPEPGSEEAERLFWARKGGKKS